ncbi:hypothetical protein B484DRAFT_455620 [Ochromonadaceae sp. CCMP2298]|nr:hypothetical protein B484DRAFT_455620 [Ochromonadaceae sp. CCMP2298]
MKDMLPGSGSAALLLAVFAMLLGSRVSGQDWPEYARRVAECEMQAMEVGNRVSDSFNTPIGDEDWNERVHQDQVISALGFAPWVANGISGSGGKTLQGSSAREVFDKSGWGGRKDVDSSPYKALNHKWIYMFGDSTTRQLWASFASPFQGNNFERNAKEWARHYCNGQTHRVRHAKHPGEFDAEGWRGPCGVNEVTCHVSGYGDKGLLSFDWKHFPYEDYDMWLFGEQGPWVGGFEGEGKRRPDILTLQMGLHSCWHANADHLSQANVSMVEQHMQDAVVLMKRVREVVEEDSRAPSLAGESTTKTQVVVVTAGSVGEVMHGTRDALAIDACVGRFNRAVERAAHEQGFAVLERGEIERRLMYKSQHAAVPLLRNEMHLPQPAQNLVSTCLLSLIACLEKETKGVDVAAALRGRTKHTHNAGAATPLHSPPAG